MTLPALSGGRSSTDRRFSRLLNSAVLLFSAYLRIAPITSLIATAALLLQSLPVLQPVAELRFTELSATDLWRLATCHLLHWSWDHFVWDVAVLLAAGTFCETRWPRRFLAVLTTAGILIPAAVMISAPQLQSYRGLSGLDSALFALAAGSLLIEEYRDGRHFSAALVAFIVLAQFLKIAAESTAGHTLFVQNAPFTPVPLAHLCGAVIGSVLSLTNKRSPEALPDQKG